ncbi:hypothetical protein PG996_015082 [Apiospora saccharicola]|uniref:Uncharacterized protein n=1 Tax=Apiospora saccharicola TaxID=335842 RepID=A0ABR1TK57_9PEZI
MTVALRPKKYSAVAIHGHFCCPVIPGLSHRPPSESTAALSVAVARNTLGAGKRADLVDPARGHAVGPEVRVEARRIARLNEDVDKAGVERRAVRLRHEGVERRVRRLWEQSDDVLVRDDVGVGAVLIGKWRQI